MEQMYAYKCLKCGKLHHPHYVVCQNPDCDGREFEPVPLGGLISTAPLPQGV